MKRQLSGLLHGVGCVLMISLANAQPSSIPGWEDDFEVVLKRAEEQKKDIFVAVLGPSSSAGCAELNKILLGGAEFRTIIGQAYVLFNILAPEDAKRDKASEKEYRKTLKRLGVSSYPIGLVTTPSGKVYGELPLQRPNATALVSATAALSPRRSMLEKALSLAESKPEGEEQLDAAKELSDTLLELGKRFAVIHHGELIDRVLELDRDNAGGLQAAWKKIRYDETSIRQFNQIYGGLFVELRLLKSAEEKVALFDKTIASNSMTNEVRQMFEWRKFDAWAHEENYPKMLETARFAQELSPDTFLGKKVLPDLISKVEALIMEAKDEKPAVEESPSELPTVKEAEAEADEADEAPQPGAPESPQE